MLSSAGINLLVTLYLADSSLLQKTEDNELQGLRLSSAGIKLL
jgi:hypothetical protein